MGEINVPPQEIIRGGERKNGRWPTKKLVRVTLRKEGGQATIVRGGGTT